MIIQYYHNSTKYMCRMIELEAWTGANWKNAKAFQEEMGTITTIPPADEICDDECQLTIQKALWKRISSMVEPKRAIGHLLLTMMNADAHA